MCYEIPRDRKQDMSLCLVTTYDTYNIGNHENLMNNL